MGKNKIVNKNNKTQNFEKKEMRIVCKSCKDTVVFIDKQESKTCPSCGALVKKI